ncbi:MAG: hypothetical protein JEZ01_04360 [Labilibaculum sp.]|nr:tubulin-like doman-containing protein [Labilibaculum sp.]MBI9056985.1 hypothetical protein [Labilibaculum sp.]
MVAKLKRSLFIGLGGTGAEAVLHTKKRFMDSFGEIPPMIGFLCIDTDEEVINKSVKSNRGEEIKIEQNEFVYSKVVSAKEPYLRHKDTLFDWVPEPNLRTMTKMTHGAGQIRSNGRFALFFNHKLIHNAVGSRLTDIMNIKNSDDKKFKANGSGVEINFVFSIGGGTGSGTFIDTAYIIQEAIKPFKGPNSPMTTIAFAVLPDVFRTMATGPSMKNVIPNGYGALVDLDYLMHQDYSSNPITINYGDKKIESVDNPFDIVFTVNNINNQGNVISHIKDISELIGMGMYTGASELSGSVSSSYDNVLAAAAGGALDIENKMSWAHGMGVSELYYDGNKLGNIYAHKATNILCNKLLEIDSDVTNTVDSFIDRDDVSIRENNGVDDIIDSLLHSSPKVPISSIDIENPKGDIQAYLNNVSNFADREVTSNYTEKVGRIIAKYKAEVVNIINQNKGIGTAIEFNKIFQKSLDIFRDEMDSELAELERKFPSIDGRIQILCEEYKKIANKFALVGKQKRIDEHEEELVATVMAMAKNTHETIRRKYAIKFLNALTEATNKKQKKLESLKAKMQTCADNALAKSRSIQNDVSDVDKTFIIELHKSDLNTVTVNELDINPESFIKTLNENNKILDFGNYEVEEMDEVLWQYSKKLNGALDLRNITIDEVLNRYPEEKVKQTIENLVQKSVPLWSTNFHGYMEKERHYDFVMGIPDSTNSRLKKQEKELFSDILQAGEKISFNQTRDPQRISIYRMEAAAPIFAVSDVMGYKQEYDKSDRSHHIDSNWLTRMKREEFSIEPKQKDMNNILASWVGGFIYGFIKNEEGTYYVYSPDKGDALDDYWLEIASSNYRDDAFKKFQSETLNEEMEKIIEKKIEAMGSEENDRLINTIKEGSTYLDSASQCGIEKDKLKTREWKEIANLLKDEINFLKKKLGN